jgi:hypothetical protein
MPGQVFLAPTSAAELTGAQRTQAPCWLDDGFAVAPNLPLGVEKLHRLLVDLHVLAVGDGRRLGRAHEMAREWVPSG